MGDEESRPDSLEQRHQRSAGRLLLHRGVHAGPLRGEELIERVIARQTGSRPLGVQVRLRPQIGPLRRREQVLGTLHARHASWAVDRSDVRRLAASRLIHDVHREAVAQQVIRPARAVVGRAGEARSQLATPVHQHDWVRTLVPLFRDLVPDVHLSRHERRIDWIVIGAANEEDALLGDLDIPERPLGFGQLPRFPGGVTQSLHQPPLDHACDLEVVLLDGHQVPVPEDPEARELHEVGRHARLVQPLCRAVVVGGVIGRLRQHVENRQPGEPRKLPSRLGLEPAGRQPGTIRLGLMHDAELGRVGRRRVVGETIDRRPPRPRHRRAGQGRVRDDLTVDRGPARLDRDQRLHQIRPRIGHHPERRAGLRVDQHDRGAELLEQRDQGVRRQLLLQRPVGDTGRQVRVVLVEDRVAVRVAAVARPLGVQGRLRPLNGRARLLRGRPQVLGLSHGRGGPEGSVHRVHVWRLRAARLVHDVDRPAVPDEIVGPAGPAVGRALEPRAGVPPAVHHDDRVRARAQLRRDLVLYVHLPRHRGRRRRIVVGTGDVEIPLLQHQWSGLTVAFLSKCHSS